MNYRYLILTLLVLLAGCRQSVAENNSDTSAEEWSSSSTASSQVQRETDDHTVESSASESMPEQDETEYLPESQPPVNQEPPTQSDRESEPAQSQPETPPQSSAAAQSESAQNSAVVENSTPPVLPSQQAPVSPLAEEVELELLRLVNRERERGGVAALGMEDSMRWAARIRSAEALQDLSHTRPDGSPYYTAFDEAGFAYAGKWHGENVGYLTFSEGMYDSHDTAFKLFEALRESPGHYQNMMEQNFSQVGIGAHVQIEGGMVRITAVQLFASL